MPVARLYTIKGRVQGVFFRASTRTVAESLGITGHAINLPDGDVQVLACGEPAALDQLGDWLHGGPAHARVDEVIAREVELEAPGGFRTG
ncbi:MAG: acylphosphatase [Gammaproteobacteria bacterium]|jgi:acylphosphatase|nr:acylphosphatase [Gammaproteobacteria bacterium]MDH3846592.1 acylphosphatase [Gammaproteobacteria bacterium]MDH3864486.1 acylphosphatase [Gammaproteobacteria bacterium]MDH3906339.1 acylphosphatase [Gammaproteobacteria bacterium]MDH4003635.1 acylphosphatase [Gammaproteobacteria bacterium]